MKKMRRSPVSNIEQAGESVQGEDDCLEALKELYVFIDGELTFERRAAISSHLDECGGCGEVFDFEVELRQVVSRCCQETVVPDHLRLRIAQAIESYGENDEDGT